MQKFNLNMFATPDAVDDVLQTLEETDEREELNDYFKYPAAMPAVQVQALLAIAAALEDICSTLGAISEKLERAKE